jgi:serine/threonine-protein kinase HipA
MVNNMARRGRVYFQDKFAGIITEDDNGYTFCYDEKYLNDAEAKVISLTMPLRKEPYHSPGMIPFFDGLIPEGWLLGIAEVNWKTNPQDRMGLLLKFCNNNIGAVRVTEEKTE